MKFEMEEKNNMFKVEIYDENSIKFIAYITADEQEITRQKIMSCITLAIENVYKIKIPLTIKIMPFNPNKEE